MAKKTTTKSVEQWMKAVSFQLTDGRPLVVNRVYEHPQTGEPVVELLDMEEHLRTAKIVKTEPACGSSNISRDWTLEEVRSLIHFLGFDAPPELVEEYLSTRSEAHFTGMSQAEIDGEFLKFLRSK
jgi:hypothetical protein